MYISNPKIVFDRSAFHPDRFNKLKSSKLEKLIQNNSFYIYHTPTFLEETLRLYSNERNRKIFKDQIYYILKICNKKWFKRREDLFYDELINDYSHKNFEFINKEDKITTELNILNQLVKDRILPERLNTLNKIYEEENVKKINNKKIFNEIRNEFTSKFSNDKKHGLNENEFYKEFLDSYIDLMGKLIIEKDNNLAKEKDVIEKWKNHKNRYSYFSKFIEGILFAVLYSFAHPNQKIDKNAITDIEFLSFLKQIDILVSNDLKFMKTAFSQLYSNENKIILTVEEFIKYLDFYN